MRFAGLLAMVALLAAAPAAASVKDFGGTFEPSGKASFALKRKQGDRTVAHWSWRNLPVTCAGKPQKTTSYFNFKMPVRKRAFEGSAVVRDGDTITGGASVTGSFTRSYRKASGTFRVWGTTQEGYQGCESGVLSWTAVQEVTPARR